MQVIRRVDKGSGEVLSVSITPAGDKVLGGMQSGDCGRIRGARGREEAKQLGTREQNSRLLQGRR